jgi:hypothetical protein
MSAVRTQPKQQGDRSLLLLMMMAEMTLPLVEESGY